MLFRGLGSKRSSIIGKWLQKKRLQKWGTKARAGDTKAVTILINVVLEAADNKLKQSAHAFLQQLRHPETIDVFCAHWNKNRNRELEDILITCSYVAKHPPHLKVLTALKVDNLQALPVNDCQIVASLIHACHNQDPDISKRAQSVLGRLQDINAINAFCRHWLQTDNPILERILVRNRYIASQPEDLHLLTALKVQQLATIVQCDREVVIPLLEACKHRDRTIAEQAEKALCNLQHLNAIDAFCSYWLAQRTPLAEKILLTGRYVARHPLKLRTLTALKVGNHKAIGEMGAECIAPLINACADQDQQITREAIKSLKNLQSVSAITALCELIIAEDDDLLTQIALEKGYAPQDDVLKAVFYFITGQWEKYATLDFQEQHPLLRQGYMQANPAVKEKILRIARSCGKSEIVSKTLVGQGKRLKVGEVEWATIVDGLKRERQWQELWRLLFLAPANWGAEIMMVLENVDWQAPASEQEIWCELRELFPYQGKNTIIPDYGRLLHTLFGHSDWIECLVVSPDEKIAASGSKDRSLKLWNLHSGDLLCSLRHHESKVSTLAITANSKIVVSGSEDSTIALWSLPQGQLITSLTGHCDEVSCLAITPDSEILVSGSWDESIRLWRISDGKQLNILNGHSDNVKCLAITPDGSLLASASYDNTICLWSLPDGKLLRTLSGHRGWVYDLAMSDDGKILASGSYDQSVQLWDLPSGRCLRTLHGHSEWVYSVVIDPQCRFVFSASRDTTIRVHKLPEGRYLQTLTGHRQGIYAITINPQGNILASASDDRSVRLWNIPDGTPLAVLEQHQQWVEHLVMGSHGKVLLSAGRDSTIYVWSISWDKALATCNHQDLEYVRNILKTKPLTYKQRRAWEFVEVLLKAKFRFDIGVEDNIVSIGEFDIEIEC